MSVKKGSIAYSLNLVIGYMTRKMLLCLTIKESKMTAKEELRKQYINEYPPEKGYRQEVHYNQWLENKAIKLHEANDRIKELEKEVKSLNQILLDTEF